MLPIGPENVFSVLIKTLGGLDGRVGGIVGERDVRELRIVGGGRGASRVPGLEGIRIDVVTGVLGDRIGEIPRVGQREIVGRIGETNGVLIKQRSEGDGVGRGDAEGDGEDAGEGGVVGPLNTVDTGVLLGEGGVLGLVGEDHDRVRETKIESRATGGDVLEGCHLGLLDLVDQDITRGITHLDALVVVDDRIVGIGLDIDESGGLVVLRDTINVSAHIGSGDTTGGSGVDDDELGPVAEVIGDLNIVERQRRDGKGNSRVFTKEEWEGERQSGTTDRGTRANGGGVIAGHTNHVQVTLTLLADATPLKVVIEPIVIILLDLEVVEFDLNVANQVVHQIVNPTDGRSRLGINRVLEADRGEASAQKGGKDIITLTRQGKACFASTELSGDSNVAEGDWNVRKPVRLLDGRDEPGNAMGATI